MGRRFDVVDVRFARTKTRAKEIVKEKRAEGRRARIIPGTPRFKFAVEVGRKKR